MPSLYPGPAFDGSGHFRNRFLILLKQRKLILYVTCLPYLRSSCCSLMRSGLSSSIVTGCSPLYVIPSFCRRSSIRSILLKTIVVFACGSISITRTFFPNLAAMLYAIACTEEDLPTPPLLLMKAYVFITSSLNSSLQFSTLLGVFLFVIISLLFYLSSFILTASIKFRHCIYFNTIPLLWCFTKKCVILWKGGALNDYI